MGYFDKLNKLINKRFVEVDEFNIQQHNVKEFLEDYAKRITILENNIFALTQILSARENQLNTSFKEGVINLYKDGIESPMFRIYVEYALSSLERGKNLVNKYRNLVPQHFEYLDVGCAYGGVVIAMAQAGANRAVGIDINDKFLQLATIHSIEQGVSDKTSFTNIDINDSNEVIGLGKFNLITCIDVLEHVMNPEQIIHSLYKLCKTDGMLIIDVPNPFCIRNIEKDPHHHLFAAVLLEREEAIKQFSYFFPKNNGYDVGFYNSLEWFKNTLHNVGFSMELIDSSPDYQETIEYLKLKVKNLSEEARQQSIRENWPDWLNDKVLNTIDHYVDQVNKDILYFNNDIKSLWEKYCIPVYHFKCTRLC